jgi:hypothetical protein
MKRGGKEGGGWKERKGKGRGDWKGRVRVFRFRIFFLYPSFRFN